VNVVKILPVFDDPRGIVEKLRAGEVPQEALRWLITGHDDLVIEVVDQLTRIKEGKSPQSLRFFEGPPGSGKTSLLRLLRDVSEDQGFATCSLSVDSKSGQFSEKRWLVPAIFRDFRVRTSEGIFGWDGVLKQLCKKLLLGFPSKTDESLNSRNQRLREYVAKQLGKYNLSEKSVEDAILTYLYAFEGNDHDRMRRVVEWFYGESLTASELHSEVGVETRIDERTAIPILCSSLPILLEIGFSGVVLCFDELVQSMHTHHVSQRQRIQELMRLFYSGFVPRTLIFVAATPDSIENQWRGLFAHPGMKSRLGAIDPPERDVDLPRYKVGLLARDSAKDVFRKVKKVYTVAYKLPEGWLDEQEKTLVQDLCPAEGVLARDFVERSVKAMDRVRKAPS
jgi:hypothetical protein